MGAIAKNWSVARAMVDFLQAAFGPSGFVVQPRLSVKLRQCLITLHHIEANAELELPQAHRAKVQRAAVALLEVVGAIHDAVEIDAVGQTEHVPGLMGEHLHAPLQEQRRVILSPRLPVKGRVVAGKAVNSYALVQGRLAKDEIPGPFGIDRKSVV